MNRRREQRTGERRRESGERNAKRVGKSGARWSNGKRAFYRSGSVPEKKEPKTRTV